MKTRNDILDELRELSPFLAGIEKTNVFTVPQGYFLTISETVLICLKEDPFLSTTGQSKILHEVPENYFENLPSSILDKIKASDYTDQDNEINRLSPLDSINKTEELFKTPVGYFDHLPTNIVLKIKEQPTAKVVEMFRYRSILKYASAAVFAGVIGLGFFTFYSKPVDHPQPPIAVASLDPAIEKGKNMDETQFDETLNNLSEEEIAKYLEKNGDETDVATLASGIEENNLPAQDDYLLDERTLQNYLDKINNVNN